MSIEYTKKVQNLSTKYWACKNNKTRWIFSKNILLLQGYGVPVDLIEHLGWAHLPLQGYDPM